MLDSLILKSFLKIRIGSVSLRIFKYGDAVAKTTKAAVIKPSMIGRDEGGGKLALMTVSYTHLTLPTIYSV